MDPTLDPILRSMAAAVRAAARICRAVQADLITAQAVEKGDRSPVTIADLAGQVVVGRRLAVACPEIPLMGEEDSSVLRGDERASERAAVLERHDPAVETARLAEFFRSSARGSDA